MVVLCRALMRFVSAPPALIVRFWCARALHDLGRGFFVSKPPRPRGAERQNLLGLSVSARSRPFASAMRAGGRRRASLCPGKRARLRLLPRRARMPVSIAASSRDWKGPVPGRGESSAALSSKEGILRFVPRRRSVNRARPPITGRKGRRSWAAVEAVGSCRRRAALPRPMAHGAGGAALEDLLQVGRRPREGYAGKICTKSSFFGPPGARKGQPPERARSGRSWPRPRAGPRE